MYKVGQKLWYVPSYRSHGSARELTIIKVGRKWITVDEGKRVDIDSLFVDGGNYSSPGRCYAERESYANRQDVIRSWQLFRCAIDGMRLPSGNLTIEQIQQAREILGL